MGDGFEGQKCSKLHDDSAGALLRIGFLECFAIAEQITAAAGSADKLAAPAPLTFYNYGALFLFEHVRVLSELMDIDTRPPPQTDMKLAATDTAEAGERQQKTLKQIAAGLRDDGSAKKLLFLVYVRRLSMTPMTSGNSVDDIAVIVIFLHGDTELLSYLFGKCKRDISDEAVSPIEIDF